ncbi:uncharacterized protein VP01_3585g1 [Puccinia sorghi]|uniref:Uncharacterized protein n=1 Tax=Puccinia sorghi TaxID=27349 RepID=A0A0L6UVA4_9BASI|nr:uncharacterized protein VP01_3585g1 [Puccinia sorghi]
MSFLACSKILINPPSQPPNLASNVDVIKVFDDDECNPTKTGSQTLKHSCIWNHLNVSTDGTEAIHQKDKNGNTKKIHGHLLQKHQLSNPRLLKKTKGSSHMDIEAGSKTGKFKPNVSIGLV